MASLFISYSRKDIERAHELTEAFTGQDLDFWIDWEGIPPTVDWWKEIEKGIEEADIFLFLLSPDSCASKVCRREIEHAAKNGKRLVPVVVRDIKADESPAELSSLNWIFLRKTDDFEVAFSRLISAIKTDYAWVQAHRQLQVKALEWERNAHKNAFLLRGEELQDAERQLATNSSKEPHPTDLQREYVFRSRQATDKQRRTITAIAVAGAILMAGLAIFGLVQARRANERADIARAGELAAQSVEVNERNFQVSLLLGIEAFRVADTVRSRGNLLDVTSDNPQLLEYLSRHTSSVNSVAFSPDGKTLASASGNGIVILWDVATLSDKGGKTPQPIGELLTGERQRTMSVTFSPDGKTLAAGNGDGTIHLWDVAAVLNTSGETQQPIAQLAGAEIGLAYTIAFSPDGKTLAVGGFENKIILWDLETLRPAGKALTGHTSPVHSLAFSPDGRTLASGSEDYTVIFWDLTSRRPIVEPRRAHGNTVMSVAFSPDGKMLASGGLDGQIILWEMGSHQPVGEPLEGRRGAVKSLAFSPEGRALASGTDDGTVILWDVEIRFPIGLPLTGHGSSVNQVSFSPDGRTLAAGSDDNMVSLWEVATLLDYTADGRQPIGQELEGHASAITCVSFSPDGALLASGSYDSTIILWDVGSRQPIGQPLTGHQNSILGVAFSPDGKLLASGSEDKTIILWDVSSRQPVGQPLKGHAEPVHKLAFHPDGRTLASLSTDSTLILWDVGSREPRGEPLTEDIITSLAFAPNGKTLAVATEDGTIMLWDLQTRRPVSQAFTGHPSLVSDLAFSPDGWTLASGGNDGAIVLWDVKTSQMVGRPLTGHTSPIDNVAFSPDGTTIVSNEHYFSMILWDVKTRQPIGRPLVGHTIINVAFSPDGRTLASGKVDGTLVVWDISPQSWMEKSCERAGRNFARAEWERYFPEEPYRKTCEQWPLGQEITIIATARP